MHFLKNDFFWNFQIREFHSWLLRKLFSRVFELRGSEIVQIVSSFRKLSIDMHAARQKLLGARQNGIFMHSSIFFCKKSMKNKHSEKYSIHGAHWMILGAHHASQWIAYEKEIWFALSPSFLAQKFVKIDFLEVSCEIVEFENSKKFIFQKVDFSKNREFHSWLLRKLFSRVFELRGSEIVQIVSSFRKLSIDMHAARQESFSARHE